MLWHSQPDWQGIYPSPQEQWSKVWGTITWVLPYLLFVLGGYYIVGDITQEEKRGTLNFIRLSPRPAWQILIGKILGVPILPYLAVLTLVPIHIFAALSGGTSLLFMVSYYLVLATSVFLCYSLALFFGLTGSSQKGFMGQQGTTAISFGALAFFVFSPIFMFWNSAVTWQHLIDNSTLLGNSAEASGLQWVYLPIGESSILTHLFTLANLAILLALIWRMVLRRFRHPRATLMSKRQSYGLVAYVEILMVGFTLSSEFNRNGWDASGAAAFLVIVSVVMLLMLMFALVPQRQALLDWSRYQARGLQSWLWADKSPMLLAMVVHLAMVYGLLLPWVFVNGLGWKYPGETIVTAIGLTNTLLIYGLFIQTVMAGRTRNPLVWTVGGLAVWMLIPPILLGVLRLTPDKIPSSAALWTFFGYPFLAWDEPFGLLFSQIGLLFQWVLLGLLVWQCDRVLKQLRQP